VHHVSGYRGYKPPTLKRNPTRRQTRVLSAFYAGELPAADDVKPRVKRGPQAEGGTNKAIAQWTALHPELFIARNKRRLATPVGYHKPIMLGWMVDGSADWIGYRSLTITADMVGTRIAQFVAIEAKRPKGGVLSEDQKAFIRAVNYAGGVAGVARNAEDAEELLR
jgi:hypothetical protein